MRKSPEPAADRDQVLGAGASIATLVAGLGAVLVLLVVPVLCGFGAIELLGRAWPEVPLTNRTIGLLATTAVAQIETLLMVRLARTTVRVD